MRKKGVIVCVFIVLGSALWGQSWKVGITYTPLFFSSITFDQDYIIFNDYSSYRTNVSGLRTSLSLSNAGFFIRKQGHTLGFQSGLNFQNNIYFYSKKEGYSGTNVPFFYGSIDCPVMATYSLFSDALCHVRFVAGANTKFFKFKRNYLSVFAKDLDNSFYAEENSSDRDRREFLVHKMNSVICYARAGLGIQMYGVGLNLYVDKNITGLNRRTDPYNANFKNSWLVSFACEFEIAGRNLHLRRSAAKISKE